MKSPTIANPLDVPLPLLAFDRGKRDCAIRCLFNLGQTPITTDLLEEWQILMETVASSQPDTFLTRSAIWVARQRIAQDSDSL
jgi:hypothetical protein